MHKRRKGYLPHGRRPFFVNLELTFFLSPSKNKENKNAVIKDSAVGGG